MIEALTIYSYTVKGIVVQSSENHWKKQTYQSITDFVMDKKITS